MLTFLKYGIMSSAVHPGTPHASRSHRWGRAYLPPDGCVSRSNYSPRPGMKAEGTAHAIIFTLLPPPRMPPVAMESFLPRASSLLFPS